MLFLLFFYLIFTGAQSSLFFTAVRPQASQAYCTFLILGLQTWRGFPMMIPQYWHSAD
jgi:hypothetical protein